MEHGFIALTILCLVVLVFIAQLAIWLFNTIGKFALALDQDNAPDILKSNIVTDMMKSLAKFASRGIDNVEKIEGKYYVADSDGWYWTVGGSDRNHNEYLRRKYCAHNTLQEAKDNPRYKQGGVTEGVIVIALYTVVGTFAAELLYFWFTTHPFSMVVFSSVAALIMFIRYISKALWKNIGKTDKLDERVTKLEEK